MKINKEFLKAILKGIGSEVYQWNELKSDLSLALELFEGPGNEVVVCVHGDGGVRICTSPQMVMIACEEMVPSLELAFTIPERHIASIAHLFDNLRYMPAYAA